MSMCNILMKRKICRLHGGITTTKLLNLINHNANLNDPSVMTLDHNSFQTCQKLSESKTFNNYLCNISINIVINTFWSK